MQWKVTIAGKDRIVKLPDRLPDNTAFEGVIDGKTIKMRWQRSTKALYIQDPLHESVWTSVNLRTRTVTKFPGESDLSVEAEFSAGGATSAIVMEANVGIFVPGQENREVGKTKKAKVVRSQITGKVLKILVSEGQTVQVGDAMLIIEAMKMENRVLATVSAAVEQVKVKEGDTVSAGSELIRFKQ